MGDTPAIGYSVTANLGGERQIVLQHFIAADETDIQVNANIDRIMGVVDRLQAIGKIPDLREEKRRLEGQIAQAERDRDAVEADYQLRVQARNERVIGAQADKKMLFDKAYGEHVANGRRSEFEPKGQTAARLNSFDAELQKLIEEAAKDDAERDVALQNLDQNLKMRQLRMRQIDDEIAELLIKV